jgi:hypothetical protein
MTKKQVKIKVFALIINPIIVTCLLISLTGCRSTYALMKADPAPVTNFMPERAKLNLMSATFPFWRFWMKEDIDWKQYTEIMVDKVNTDHMLDDSWWDKVNTAQATEMKKDIKTIADYMQKTFTNALKDDEKLRLKVVDKVGPKTLVLKLALINLVPTKAFFNMCTTVAGFFIPGAGLAAIANSGSVAIEGMLVDGGTGKPLVMFTDQKCDRAAALDLAGYTWYAHSYKIIQLWANKFIEVINAKDYKDVKDQLPVTIIST